MKKDVYQEVTNKICAAIEAAQASGARWALPWRKVDGFAGRPTNATTRNAYRGVNNALLWMGAEAGGYTDQRWATFKQWQGVGASVRKGEKGTMIVFYKKLDITDRATGEAKTIPLLRSSYVFNIAQVNNCPERIAAPAAVEKLQDATQRLAAVDALIAASGAEIRHGGNSAFYSPSHDFIQMPHREQFIGDAQQATEAYYSTELHELTHWTGHTSRLDRVKGSAFASKPYAFEELIAELGAAFLCADLGVTNVPRDDHAQYLASWLKVLRDDDRAIFKAASAAEKACDFLHAAADAAAAADAEPLPLAA